jgi:phosphonate transport system substrate-binding protein
MSNTGRVYPVFLLQELGESADTFFLTSFFTYSHDRAIDAVSDGVADGAAVDSLVLEHAILRDPTHAERIRTIQTSPAFGIPPVVVPAGLSPRLRAELEELLLNLDSDPAGPQVLAQLGIDRFVRGDDSAYDGVRMMVDATGIGR